MSNRIGFNPFLRGYYEFRIERLAIILTEDFPWKLHHTVIHPSQNQLKDYEFKNHNAIFSDTYVLIDNSLVNEDLRAGCSYRGLFLKIVYRITATSCNSHSEIIIGEPSELAYAQDIVRNLQFETDVYSRCWEINRKHITQADFEQLFGFAKNVSQNIVQGPFLTDLFVLDEHEDDGDFSLGIRLNRMPWTDEHLSYIGWDGTDELREHFLIYGLSPAFADVMMNAGQAGVRILIFRENGKVIDGLKTHYWSGDTEN